MGAGNINDDTTVDANNLVTKEEIKIREKFRKLVKNKVQFKDVEVSEFVTELVSELLEDIE